MEMEYHQQQHQVNRPVAVGGGGGGGGTLFNTSSSSDLNHSSSSNSNSNSNSNNQRQNQEDPMQSWWESVSKARSRIHALLSLLLPPSSSSDYSDSLSSLADSDRPARSFLDSVDAYSAVSSALSGSGDDPLCQWLYDTFQQSESDSDLRLVVVSFVPLVAGLYLSRIHAFSTTSPPNSPSPSPSLAGFEAVLLALYSSETKSRAGKPLLVSIPTPAYLSHHPSLYHHPHPNPNPNPTTKSSATAQPMPSVGVGVGVGVGVVSPPLEPQVGIKSTKRGCIVGVAFHCFYKHISQMPRWSKLDLCRFAASWAGDDCPCALSLDFSPPTLQHDAHDDDDDDDDDDDVTVNGDAVSSSSSRTALSPSLNCTSSSTNGVTLSRMMIEHHHHQHQHHQGEIISENSGNQATIEGQGEGEGARIPVPWEVLQPMVRILGHCLLAPPPLNSDEIKDAASIAVRRLYARASHDLSPQAILATRSLVQLDNRSRAAAKAAALANASSNANTPKPKKPEVLLVSK